MSKRRGKEVRLGGDDADAAFADPFEPMGVATGTGIASIATVANAPVEAATAAPHDGQLLLVTASSELHVMHRSIVFTNYGLQPTIVRPVHRSASASRLIAKRRKWQSPSTAPSSLNRKACTRK